MSQRVKDVCVAEVRDMLADDGCEGGGGGGGRYVVADILYGALLTLRG